MRHTVLAALCALAASFAPASLMAEETPSAQAAVIDPYADLYNAMREGVDDQQVLDNTINTIVTEMQHIVPELSLIEEQKPGLFNSLRQNMRPLLEEYSLRLITAYQPSIIEELRAHLSAREANTLSEIYRSTLGKKLLSGLSQNTNSQDTIRSMMSDNNAQVDADVVGGDIRRASIKSYLALSPDDREALNQLVVDNPVFAKFAVLQPKLNAIRAEMESEPLLPEEQARLNSVLEQTFAQYLAAD